MLTYHGWHHKSMERKVRAQVCSSPRSISLFLTHNDVWNVVGGTCFWSRFSTLCGSNYWTLSLEGTNLSRIWCRNPWNLMFLLYFHWNGAVSLGWCWVVGWLSAELHYSLASTVYWGQVDQWPPWRWLASAQGSLHFVCACMYKCVRALSLPVKIPSPGHNYFHESLSNKFSHKKLLPWREWVQTLNDAALLATQIPWRGFVDMILCL